MAASIQRLCLSTSPLIFESILRNTPSVSLYQRREGHKVNIKYPRPGSWPRQLIVKVTEPIYPEIQVNPSNTCTRRSSLPNSFDILSEYEEFLVNHQKKLHNENADGILAFYHLGSCSAKLFNKYRVAFRKQEFDIARLNRKVFHHAVKDTKYETLNTIIFQSTVLVMCPKPKVLEMVELAKKVPPLYLLCAVVEGRLLSKTGVETYASYPDKLSLLAQTSATLSQSSQQITRLLNSHQTLLSTNLKTYSDSNS
ncbi:hypothetical protein EB796_007701 [Bugula neritina]|uniref:Large ribosomal subunit protein uL10m n=1 Tax=Bugula neritina TaxID=10212 RepID=A0A7J7K5T5_BUGNE|nr:hypothetical protein EB796_007701 [Bugula neritina]